jgi:hypothetical protein
MSQVTPKISKFNFLFIAFGRIITKCIFVSRNKAHNPLATLSRTSFDQLFNKDKAHMFKVLNILDGLLDKIESEIGILPKEGLMSGDKEKQLRDVWGLFYEASFEVDLIRRHYLWWYRFDPATGQRPQHVKSFLMTYYAEVALYTIGRSFIKLVEVNSNIVKFLNAPNDILGLKAGSYNRFRRELTSIKEQSRIMAGKQYKNLLATGLNVIEKLPNWDCDILWTRIERDLEVIEKEQTMRPVYIKAGIEMRLLKKGAFDFFFIGQTGVAKWMGRHRAQKVLGEYLVTQSQLDEMEKILEPGDILFARKNWVLSNLGLPGFWPHAMLYVGSREKLDAYFNDAETSKYITSLIGRKCSFTEYLLARHRGVFARYLHDDVHTKDSGRCSVIEGVNPKVRICSLKSCYGDYMAAIRPTLNKVDKARAIIEAFGYVDKPYDMNFDFASDDKLVCTELVWLSYRPSEDHIGVQIELVSIAGRKTLPAHEFMKCYAKEKGSAQQQFDFVHFIDCNEKAQKTFVANEKAFMTTLNRSKWSFNQA